MWFWWLSPIQESVWRITLSAALIGKSSGNSQPDQGGPARRQDHCTTFFTKSRFRENKSDELVNVLSYVVKIVKYIENNVLNLSVLIM